MGAMTRVLNEDYRRSIDLTTNIMTIFCKYVGVLSPLASVHCLVANPLRESSMSTFHDLHAALMEYRVGDITMRVLELENSRYQSRQQVGCFAQAAGGRVVLMWWRCAYRRWSGWHSWPMPSSEVTNSSRQGFAANGRRAYRRRGLAWCSRWRVQ